MMHTPLDTKRYDTDGYETNSSKEQLAVEDRVSQLYERFRKACPKETLYQLMQREKHVHFLKRGLVHLSKIHEALDASRPWLCYWILHSLNLLHYKLTASEKQCVARFLTSLQSPTGGYGGGPSQFPHLAATYAAINALASLKSCEALSKVDRKMLLRFVKEVKMGDGSFRMHLGGEVDVRSVYCAIVVCTLANVQEPGLFDGTAEWIAKCQTYEGGFGGYPGMEAHGGYTFCAIASLALLKRIPLINIDRLIRWLCQRQMSYQGGFQGRSNKLVDACYSFWQGASFAILSPFCRDAASSDEHEKPVLFHEGSLEEYLLICCQHQLGGFIDKPGKQRDFYHTCYALSGLSVAQNTVSAENRTTFCNELVLSPINPIFNLTVDSLEQALMYFEQLEPVSNEEEKMQE